MSLATFRGALHPMIDRLVDAESHPRCHSEADVTVGSRPSTGGSVVERFE